MNSPGRVVRWLVLAILALTALGGWISGELVKQHADIWDSTAGQSPVSLQAGSDQSRDREGAVSGGQKDRSLTVAALSRNAGARKNSRTSSTGDGLFVRLCQAGEQVGFDCAGTLKSGWAEIRLPVPWYSISGGASLRRFGVPVALAGLSYFVFLGVWFVLVGGRSLPLPLREMAGVRVIPHSQRSRPAGGTYLAFLSRIGPAWHRLPLVVIRCGALASIFFLGLMALGRAPWCLWCIAIHAINFVLLVAIEWLCREAASGNTALAIGGDSPERLARLTLTTRDALRTVGVALAFIAGLWVYHHQHVAFGDTLQGLKRYQRLVRSMREDPAFLLREYDAQPSVLPLTPRERVKNGDAAGDSRPQLVVFTDFQCSACRCNARAVEEQIIPAFGGKLDLILRHYPLCRKCNDQVSADRHPLACDAAYAAEAARLVGGENGFRQMCDLLFRHRTGLSEATFPVLAQQIGLDAADFQTAMNGPAVRDGVQADVELGRQLGISGTPTMFLDGRRVPELCQTPVFWKAVASRCESANSRMKGAASEVAASMRPGED